MALAKSVSMVPFMALWTLARSKVMVATPRIDAGQNSLFGHSFVIRHGLVITCDRRFIQRPSPKHCKEGSLPWS
jgi:hypothetical protein